MCEYGMQRTVQVLAVHCVLKRCSDIVASLVVSLAGLTQGNANPSMDGGLDKTAAQNLKILYANYMGNSQYFGLTILKGQYGNLFYIGKPLHLICSCKCQRAPSQLQNLTLIKLFFCRSCPLWYCKCSKEACEDRASTFRNVS